MTYALPTVIDFLYKIEAENRRAYEAACKLLHPEPPAEILHYLAEKRLGARFDGLLVQISEMVNSATIKKSITDWPFEYFWDNPLEPRHTKLLGYFFNPKEDHGFGEHLLNAFFDVLNNTEDPGCQNWPLLRASNKYEVHVVGIEHFQ